MHFNSINCIWICRLRNGGNLLRPQCVKYRHTSNKLNTWLQWIGLRQLQGEKRNIKVLWFSATYARGLTVLFSRNMVDATIYILIDNLVWFPPLLFSRRCSHRIFFGQELFPFGYIYKIANSIFISRRLRLYKRVTLKCLLISIQSCYIR